MPEPQTTDEEHDCPACSTPIAIELNWNNLGNSILCPHCDEKLDISYDESSDEESGDEFGWFYLEKAYVPLQS